MRPGRFRVAESTSDMTIFGKELTSIIDLGTIDLALSF
jgi:hypothetical protein